MGVRLQHFRSESVKLKAIYATSFAFGALMAATQPAWAQYDPAEFPKALDEPNLRAWLSARTNLSPNSVISIGSNSIIALRSVTPATSGGARSRVQIRAEVVNSRTATAGGYLSWSADMDVDCATKRSRALGIVNYPARDLKGVGQPAGGPSADWVTPTAGTQLYTVVNAVCDSGFQRPLAPLTVAQQPAPPATVVAAAPPPRTQVVVAPPAAVVKPAVVAVAPAPPPAATFQAAPPQVPMAPPEPPQKPAETAPPARVQVAVAPPPQSGEGDARTPQPPPAATFGPAPSEMAMAKPPTQTRAAAPRPVRGNSKVALQVAAVSTEADARRALAKARSQSSQAAAVTGAVVRAEVNGRTVYRAIFHQFADREAAVSACGQLKRSGGACFIRDGLSVPSR